MRRVAPLAIIFITIFVDLVGFGIILPVLPFYALAFDASATQIGLLAASYSLMQFIFSPVWGRLSDRFGRRPILLMSLLGSSISLALFGLANSLAGLFVARLLAGTFTANVATAQAYIADVTSDAERARGMGLVGAAFGLGFIFGPAIGGVLSQYGYAVPAYFAAALALINFGSALLLLPESRTRQELNAARVQKNSSRFNVRAIREALTHPLVGIFLIVYFLFILAFSNMEATFALLTEHNFGYDARENGYLFTFIGVVIAVMNGALIGPLARRFGEGTLLTSGLMLQALTFVLLPYMRSLLQLLIVAGLIAVGNGLSSPSLHSLISRNTTRERQGGTLGVSQSMGSLARVFGPSMGGWFFDVFGVPAPYWSGGILMLACALLSIVATNNLRRRLAVAAEKRVPSSQAT